ncbi:MAG: HEAT repeat domain-containing protein [Terriglobales bacterium]
MSVDPSANVLRRGEKLINRIRYLGCLVFLLLLAGRPAFAIKVPSGIDSCPTLDSCLKLLDSVVPANDDGEGSNSDVIAGFLRRFGEPAKRELLKKAIGSHPGWRNVAGAILSEWGSWRPSDVPELRAALRKDPGGWTARPLGEIGTPDAIEALVEDLPNGSENQTDFALSHLGSKAIPYLFPLLEDDQDTESASRVISEMGAAAVPFASSWVALATEPGKPLKERLAALRGIAAVGDGARTASAGLHGLLSDPHPKLREQADMTLKAVHDPIVVEEVVGSCHPSAAPFDSVAISSLLCLREIASYGDGARRVGGKLMPFVSSRNGAERAYGMTVLGLIDYQPAIPQIEEALNSNDWRVVYAAIRSLGWLGAKSTTPEIEKTGSNYWLPEVRENAARVATALRSSEGRVEWPSRDWLVPSRYGFQHELFTIDAQVLREASACPGGSWRWKEISFKIPTRTERQAESLRFRDGELVGTDHGEFGGELAWLPSNGQPQTILKDNVTQMERDEDGAIALVGLAHMSFDYGYVLKMERTARETWNLTEVARLPAKADGLTALSSDLFAARSFGRVVVFSSKQGILGLATCDSP